MWFIVIHEVEVTLVTLEEGAGVSIWERKLIRDICKHTFLSSVVRDWCHG